MAKVISNKKLKHYWPVYLFVLPSVLLVGAFSYFPAANAMYHAFFRWNGDDFSYWVGDKHFVKLLGHYWLWILALLSFCAVLYSSRSKHWFAKAAQVNGGIVWPTVAVIVLLAKKWALNNYPAKISSFADYLGTGVFINHLVFGIVFWGIILLMVKFLISSENDNKWLYLLIVFDFLIVSLGKSFCLKADFAWLVVLLLNGVAMWLVPKLKAISNIATIRTFQAFAAMAVCFWTLALHSGGDPTFWGGFTIVFILVLFNIPKMIPSILTAVVIHRLKSERWNYLYRVLFVVPMIIPGMVFLLLWKFFFDPSVGMFNRILIYSKIMDILIWLDKTLGWGEIFKEGTMPVWLGNEHLVLPALILWGFPWVGIVGVLIYLAGLQGIPISVYEAANLDGASSIKKFIHIELPLILTQVRINLVLMIIGTLKTYAFIMILFGNTGGPNGKLMVPGLFMFNEAFIGGRAGYACAIGLVLFFFILLLTEINNRYVRIEK